MYRLIRLLVDLPNNRLREDPLSSGYHAWRELKKIAKSRGRASRPRDFARTFTNDLAQPPKRKNDYPRSNQTMTASGINTVCLSSLNEAGTKNNRLPSWSGWIQQCSWYLWVNVAIVQNITVIYLIFKLHRHHFRALWTACTLVRLITGSNRTSNDHKQENDQGSDKEHAHGRSYEYVWQRWLGFGREGCLLLRVRSGMRSRWVQVLCVSSTIWHWEIMIRKISRLHALAILWNNLGQEPSCLGV